MTLTVIALDRYVVITRPLASLGAMSRRKALSILALAWLYSLGWSLPPFFGWSKYDPDGESPGSLFPQGRLAADPLGGFRRLSGTFPSTLSLTFLTFQSFYASA